MCGQPWCFSESVRYFLTIRTSPHCFLHPPLFTTKNQPSSSPISPSAAAAVIFLTRAVCRISQLRLLKSTPLEASPVDPHSPRDSERRPKNQPPDDALFSSQKKELPATNLFPSVALASHEVALFIAPGASVLSASCAFILLLLAHAFYIIVGWEIGGLRIRYSWPCLV